MRVKKFKKIIAVVLAISILAGVMAVCTGLFAGAESENLLKGGSFESTYGLWNSVAQNNNGDDGYKDKLIGIGQHNLVAEGWVATNDRGTRIAVDHTTDAKDGNYALKFNIPSASDTVPITLYPKVECVDASSLSASGAYYKLTAWVKGTNSKSRLEIKTTDGKVYTQAITVGQTWHKVSLDNIYLSKSAGFAGVNSNKGFHIAVIVNKDTAEETELYIDNISLNLTDNILTDGGFESADGIWNNATNSSTGMEGYTDYYVGREQTNTVSKGFAAYHSYASGSQKETTAIAMDHTSNGRSGYALHFKMPAISGTKMVMFPRKSTTDLTAVKEGYYTLAVWVRGTTDKAKLEVETNDKTYETPIPRSMDWQRVVIDNIYLTDNAANLKSYRPDTSRQEGYAIKLRMETTADYKTELMVDDISLTPIEFMSNADFENGSSGWVGSSASGATSESVELTDAKSGSRALRLSLPASSGITVSEVALPKADLTQGFYMLAFWAKGSGTLKAETAQGRDNSSLDCTLSDEWQLFVQKDIVVDSGELDSLKFIADNAGSAAAEIYIDNVQFYRQVGPGGYIDMLSAKIDKRGELQLTVPPEGYEITVLSSSNEEIIALDGKVNLPSESTTVDLVLKMTNINDATDTAKSEIVKVTVPAANGGSTVTNNPFVINNGFEGNTVALKTVSGGKEYPGVIGRGQTNLIVDGWNGFNWWEGNSATNAPVFTMSAGRSGNDSLKVTSPAGQKGSSVYFYPTSANLDKSGIEGGKYKLSVWVRGTNGHANNKLRFAALEADGKTVKEYTAAITSGEEWHEIVINDIYLTPNGENLHNIEVNGSGVSPFVIQVRGVNDTETYLEFDDITLTRTGDAGALKDDAILQNGSFERNGIGEWGFKDKTLPKNQCNYIIEGWRSQQWADSNIPTAVSHITDANDGKYSLKFDVPVGANTLTMLPDTSAVDTTTITEGFYNLTFYTKGINAKSSIKVKTTSSYGSTAEKVYEAKIAPSLEWQEVTIENIYLTANGANLAKASTAWENGSKEITAKHIAFAITADTQDTEIYIDNIALEKAANSDQQLTAIIKKGDFEGSEILLDSNGNPIVASGQDNEIVSGWMGFNWTNGVNDAAKASIVTGRNGGSALRINSPAAQQTWEPLYITAKADNINTVNITEGYYTLSLWVRSTLGGDKAIVAVRTTDKDYTANITAGEEWHEIKVENIYLTANGANMSPYKCYDRNLSSAIAILVDGNGSDTYVEIDDITLTKGQAPAPPAPQVTELIIDGGFEASKTGVDVGADNISISGSGQTNALLGGFAAFTWDKSALTRAHTTDSRSGYALKSTVVGGNTWDYHNYFLRQSNIDATKLTAGKYTLSIWVKGNNTNAYLAFGDQKVNVPADAATEWKQIKIENITLNSIDDLGPEGSAAGDNVARYSKIVFRVPHYVGTSVIIDDISLVKQEEIPTPAAQNILKNSSFEDFTCAADGQHKPGNGQVNVLATGWYNSDHWRNSSTQAVVTHSTDAKSGSYALRVDMPANGAAFRIITPDVDNLTTLSGAYTLSFWIKGDSAIVKAQSHNGSSWVDVQTVSLTSEWTKVTVSISEISYYAKNFNNDGGTNNKDTLGVCVYFKGVADKASYAIIDDISLTKAS